MVESSLWPLVVYFGSILVLVLSILALSSVVGQKSANAAAAEPFESGIVHIGSARVTVSVDFYLVALFFVIFDLETVFIFAWAIAFEELGAFGYTAIAVFILILVIALVYEWKSGALEWGVKTRLTKPLPYHLDAAEKS